jgi:transcriptional regulator with XRE-family HTH domain/KaiC/GvpD/RAD55 family RecA-like ATPase
MFKKKIRVSSGVAQLDTLLGGLYIGDNVVWHDDAGSLAAIFSFNFIRESHAQNKPLIYVSFDRSPKMILEDLGPLAENQQLTILDCFTHGKGNGSEVFSQFYEKDGARWPYQIIKVNEPWNPDIVSESIYSLHKTMTGDIRFVFETLTGMQDVWGSEEAIIKFYSRSCPRLYELDTIAYWIMEKGAHSKRTKAHINQIAQVAIELSAKSGKSSLTILKADKRKPDTLNMPVGFWNDGMCLIFESEKGKNIKLDIGAKVKALRAEQGFSQKELAETVSVTPSTISQIESSAIYPSLPVLFKLAQALNVDISSFFHDRNDIAERSLFSGEGVKISFADLPKGSIHGIRLSPVDFEARAEPYIIEISPNKKLPSHFFVHKGEEMGYLLSGKLRFTLGETVHTADVGDVIYLKTHMPSQWQNTGPEPAKLLWIKINPPS